MVAKSGSWTRQGEAFWRPHHEAWKRSDLNQRQYCEAYGGGQRWATVCSPITTAKLNNVEPFAYLTDALERMSGGHPMSQLDDLLPWNWRPLTALN